MARDAWGGDAVRQWVLQGGLRYSPDHLDRGPLLLWGRGYWEERYARVRRGALLRVLVGFPVVAFPVGILIPPTLYVLLFGYAFLAAYYLGMHARTVGDLRRGGAVPGIYKEGLELPMFPLYMSRTFIPWGEVEDVFVYPGIMSETLVVAIRDSRWRWRFPKAILGAEGVAFIRDRVRPAPEVPQPPGVVTTPRLVVYSVHGAKMESFPEGEER
jgi:hypothetical protein